MLADNPEQQLAIKQWLRTQKGYTSRSASDFVSRCKRAERYLGTALDQLISSGHDANAILELVECSIAATEQQEHAQRIARSLTTSVRKYIEFSHTRGTSTS